MKNLKYIQIFEAFESKILSKTLNYIESGDRNIFMQKLKELCKSIDFPLSKMSDEYFEYLPFKSAIYKAAMTGDEPCEATSESEFSSRYSVPGEKCTNGKIKRKWGSGIRDVVCSVCDGTGIKPKKSEIKLIKFWFTAEGKFVANTLVDGVIRNSGSIAGDSLSKKISDYTIGQPVSLDQLKGGEIVCLDFPDTFGSGDPRGSNVVAYIYKYGSGSSSRYFAIQNVNSGSTPGDDGWKKFGRLSWMLGGNDYQNLRLLTPKTKSKDDEIDPYSWNTGMDISRGSVRNNTYVDVKSQIKDAHFAIVLDFGKLKKSEFEKVEDTEKSRELAKKGSKLDPDQSNESIKKKNIERYVNLLSQKLDISTDIANCNRLITRSIGHRSALYIVYGSNIYSSLGEIISEYIKFMSSTDDVYKKKYAQDISDSTNDLFKSGMRKAAQSDDVIKNLKLMIRDNNLQNSDKHLKLLDLTQNLSDTIYNNIKNYQINDIEDLEVVAQKISSIRNILKSNRYGLTYYFSYVIEYICSGRADRAYNYLTNSGYIDIDNILEGLPRVITIISKM
jgi:hypothetical protein